MYKRQDGVRYTNREYDNWGNKYYFGSDGALATNTDVTLNGTVYTADSQGILTVKNDVNAKAVSYTHLDVYKRQGLRSTRFPFQLGRWLT